MNRRACSKLHPRAAALQRVYLNVWRLHAQPFDALARQVAWMVCFVVYSALLSPLHDLEHGQSLGVLSTASAIVLGALFWVIVCAVLAGTWDRHRQTTRLATSS